jgi:hypothetical protein
MGCLVIAGSSGCDDRVATEVTDPPGVTTVRVFADENVSLFTKVILVELTTVKLATLVVPILTEVAPEKFVPVIVTVLPYVGFVGVNEVIVGTNAVHFAYKMASEATL